MLQPVTDGEDVREREGAELDSALVSSRAVPVTCSRSVLFEISFRGRNYTVLATRSAHVDGKYQR